MNICPCINCISFAVCNAQVNEFIDSFEKPPVTNKLYLAYENVLMKQCPCIDCITFPICKAQVDEYMKTYYVDTNNNIYGSTMYTVLEAKCSLIRKWVNESYTKNPKRFTIIHRVYKKG